MASKGLEKFALLFSSIFFLFPMIFKDEKINPKQDSDSVSVDIIKGSLPAPMSLGV